MKARLGKTFLLVEPQQVSLHLLLRETSDRVRSELTEQAVKFIAVSFDGARTISL